MPYNLLYTRNRVTDSIFEVTDVPISEQSIMIEPISFLNNFRREFGRVCPLVPNVSGSFEEGRSRTVNFAKTRIFIDDFPAPFFLRFYPRYNISKFAVSVYTGEAGNSPVYKTIPNLSNRYKLISGRIDVSFDAGVTSPLSIFSGCISAFLLGGPSQRIYARLSNGSYAWVKEGNWNSVTVITAVQYSSARVAPFVDL